VWAGFCASSKTASNINPINPKDVLIAQAKSTTNQKAKKAI
jgi:hypothetical protein